MGFDFFRRVFGKGPEEATKKVAEEATSLLELEEQENALLSRLRIELQKECSKIRGKNPHLNTALDTVESLHEEKRISEKIKTAGNLKTVLMTSPEIQKIAIALEENYQKQEATALAIKKDEREMPQP